VYSYKLYNTIKLELNYNERDMILIQRYMKDLSSKRPLMFTAGC